MIVERLAAVMASVSDWLKFAETKLTVLITVNGAAAFAASQILTSDKFPSYVSYGTLIYLFFTTISIVIALIGIFPQVKIKPIMPHSSQSNQDNLIFYGDALKYEPPDYLRAFCVMNNFRYEDTGNYELMLAKQIVINSKICSSKFRVFSWSIRSAMYGIIAFFEIILIGILTNLY